MQSNNALINAITTALLACTACGDNTAIDTDSLGFTEYTLMAPPGYASFYIGKQVLEEVAATGKFEPRDTISYSMIRIPAARVDEARTNGAVTISLCETLADVTIFHNDVGSVYEADPPDSVNCSPEVTRYDGRLTIEYHSGADGLYGFVEIGETENHQLAARAFVANRMPSACPDDTSHSESDMRLGSFALQPDEQVIANCLPPDE